MIDNSGWDWELGSKQIADTRQWAKAFNWVEELHTSPDGERVAAIVNLDEAQFSICVNGKSWEKVFDKIWYPRFGPKGQMTAIVSEAGEWTIAVDGESWENKFGYVWNLMFSPDGESIAAAIQQDMTYGMVRNDVPWGQTFSNLTHPVISPDGSKTGAAVQVVDFSEGEIHKFQQGAYAAAVDGHVLDGIFVNVWKTALSPNGQKIAAEVRLNLYDYTIAVDGHPWENVFDCVWEPLFHPSDDTVTAPVRIDGQWTLARDGEILWPKRFVQLWNHRYSPDGGRVAAIVAPKFGCWTVAVDGQPWSLTFNAMVVDLVFSPDSRRVAALTKNDDRWSVIVDDSKWRHDFSMVGPPVFSPQSNHLAIKTEIDGRCSVAVDDFVWDRDFDKVWDPVFSPDGERLLICAVDAGKVFRHVIKVNEIGH